MLVVVKDKFRPKHIMYNTERQAEILPLLESGLSYQEIADKLSVSKQLIGYYAKRLNHHRRKPRLIKAYEGLKHQSSDGYIYIFHGGKRILEQRLIMEQLLGRPLDKNEIVHHINRDKADNRVKNLQLLRRGEHTRMTLKEQCQGCLIMRDNKQLRARIKELEDSLQAHLSTIIV